MKTIEEVEQRLGQVSKKLASLPSCADDVMWRIEQPSTPLRLERRGWKIGSAIGLAACVLLGIGAWLIVSIMTNNSLYARAIAALDEARTVHAVFNRWQDGKWVKGAEIFYERGVGVHEWAIHRGKPLVRIDDGTHEWRFSPDDPTVRKSPTRDPIGVVREILKENKNIDKAKRDESGDQTVDGIKCKLYTLSREKVRYRAWIDDEDRIRKFEEDALKDGKWAPEELSTVQYDVDVDRKMFVPQLPANSRIIEAKKSLDASFSLGDAKYKQETDELIFAVHRVERLENGWFFVVSSLQPTDATRAEIRNNDSGPAARNYASLQMGTSFKRFKDDPNKMRSYVPYTLARAYHDGLDIQWTLFEAVGAWEIEPNTFEVSWRFNADGKLAEKLQAQGSPTWAEHRSVAQLKAEPRKAAITDIAAETYEAIDELETIAAIVRLELKSIPFTDQEMQEHLRHNPRHPRLLHGRAEPPSKVTLEQFLAELDARIKESQAQRAKNEAR